MREGTQVGEGAAAAIEGGPPANLLAGMTQALAEHGYAGASVARVAAAGGTSRAAFYRHFTSREECFLAAYRAALNTVEAAWETASGDPDRARSGLMALAETAEADSSLARLLLVEAWAGPRELHAEHQRLLLDTERSALADPACNVLLPPAAAYGGIASLLSDSLLGVRDATPGELRPGLETWLRSYALPAERLHWSEEDWARCGRSFGPAPCPAPAPPPRRLPRGQTALSPEDAAADRKERIIDATCEVVAEKGYGAATVAHVVAAARVTRAAFYSHFQCKQDAFVAALTRGLQESAAAVAGAFFLGDDWPDRIWRGCDAFLTYVASHPEAAWLGFVEIFAAGEPALRQAGENRLAFTLFLAGGYTQSPGAEKLPPICSDAIAGAIEAIVRRQVLAARVHRCRELLPQCAYVALAPFIGPEAALETILARIPGARQAT